jgi:hypothetical protein
VYCFARARPVENEIEIDGGLPMQSVDDRSIHSGCLLFETFGSLAHLFLVAGSKLTTSRP